MREHWQAICGAALLGAVCIAGPTTTGMARDVRVTGPSQVSVSFSIVLPASAESGLHGRFSSTDGMRRAFYEFVTRECELLLATIAATCQLTNANVNVSEQRHNQPSPYVQINGSGSFAIMLKPRP